MIDIGVRVLGFVVACFFYFGGICLIHQAIFGWCVGSGCEYWKNFKENPPVIELVIASFIFIVGSVFVYWAII